MSSLCILASELARQEHGGSQSARLVRTRSADQGTFNAQAQAWPSLEEAKDAPRRSRRLTRPLLQSAQVRTATCPPIIRGRKLSSCSGDQSEIQASRSLQASPREHRERKVSIEVPSTDQVAVEEQQDTAAASRSRRVSIASDVAESTPWQYEHPPPAAIVVASPDLIAEKTPLSPDFTIMTPVNGAGPAANLDNGTPGRDCATDPKLKNLMTPDGLTSAPGGEGKKRTSIDRQFVSWVEERPALCRIGHQSGKAWEYPLSRADKQELLILQLAAENVVHSQTP